MILKSMNSRFVKIILFDFYILALTPRINSSETSLQLSENITFFVACRIHTGVITKDT
jgi:hypothetical protein